MISLRATNECIKMPFILDDHFHDINFTGNTQVADILEKYEEGGGVGWGWEVGRLKKYNSVHQRIEIIKEQRAQVTDK